MKLFFSFLFSLAIYFGNCQFATTTLSDSALTMYQYVQNEIKTKEIGEFEYTIKDESTKISTKIIVKNFYPKGDTSTVWSIVSEFNYNEKGYLLHKLYWKTNNIDKACRCNVWHEHVKKLIEISTYHPRCNKIKLNCDINGRYATK